MSVNKISQIRDGLAVAIEGGAYMPLEKAAIDARNLLSDLELKFDNSSPVPLNALLDSTTVFHPNEYLGQVVRQLLAYFRVAPFYGALKSPRGLALRLLELPHHYAKLGSHECNVITVDALMRELEFMPEPDPAAGCVSPAVFAAILKVARVNRDLRDFDGDKRGIMESAEDAEESLISLICKDPALLELVDAGE